MKTMISINLCDEEDFLIEKTGFCPVVVHDYIVGQNAFYEKKGLLVFDDICHEPESSETMIDENEKCEYISNITDIELEVCKEISKAELEYLKKLGVVDDDPIEYDMLDRVIGRLDQCQRHEVLNVIRKMYDLK